MGTAFGNIIGFIILTILLITSIFFPYGGVVAFVSIMYTSWLLVLLSYFATMPKKDAPVFSVFSNNEIQTYKMFHLAIWFPEGSAIYSSVLNLFRFAGIVWGMVCLWNEFYYIGLIMIAYYFISSGMIVKHNPYLYLSEGAKNGNAFAINEMAILQSIIEKRNEYNKKTNG